MKLVDMKLKKRSTKDSLPEPYDGEKYPYGMKLSFDKEQIDKMPELKNVQAGAMVDLMAVGKVTEVRITERRDNSRHSVEIQIQQIGVVPRKKLGKMNMAEYNAARDKGRIQ